ncbi:hypothetical protein GCM10027077_21080 [Arenimonas maotaiensis]
MHAWKVMRVFRYKAYMMIYMRCKGDLGQARTIVTDLEKVCSLQLNVLLG